MNVRDLAFEEWRNTEDSHLIGARLADGSMITVLDRLTGYGDGDIWDTETGYRDSSGAFWLASGKFDIRDWPDKTVDEAIDWIKAAANTCCGD